MKDTANYFVRGIFNCSEKIYNIRTAKTLIYETWKDIDFAVLGLKAKARLLLNPFDEGFSREFYRYGFREPLNTLSVFRTIEKTRPVILDIGSNLGYFSLIELQAGAKQVIAIEPVPTTFALLQRTLKEYKNVTTANIAISDEVENLKLYVSNKRNVTSSSMFLLRHYGHEIVNEIIVSALPLIDLVKRHPISMIRMDVEGHEYKILKGEIPNQIETICIELHVLRPYNKTHATRLLQHLDRQGFQASIVIKEMEPRYYPFVKFLGLKRAYKLMTALERNTSKGPNVQRSVSFSELLRMTPEIGQIHLILQR